MPEYFLNRSNMKDKIGSFIRHEKTEGIHNLLFLIKLVIIYFFIYCIFYFNYWVFKHYGLRVTYILPVLIIIIGCLQYIIAQASHEAIHFHIKHENTPYSILCTFLILYPIGVTKNYKKNHALHHIYFGDEEQDPDHLTFMAPPRSKVQFWLMLIESFLGISTVKRIINLLRYRKKKTNHDSILTMGITVEFFKVVIVQSILLSAFIIAGIGWSYFILWILPLALITKSLINIRLLAEHSPFGNTEPALRSFLKTDWSSDLLGVFGFKFHAEHHLFPGIPYYKLHKISGLIEQHATNVRQTNQDYKIELSNLSYVQFLKKYYDSLPVN